MGGAEHSRRAAVRRSRAHRKLAAGGGGADHAGAAARSSRAMKFADCLFGAEAGRRIEAISALEPPTPRSLRRKASTCGAKPFRSNADHTVKPLHPQRALSARLSGDRGRGHRARRLRDHARARRRARQQRHRRIARRHVGAGLCHAVPQGRRSPDQYLGQPRGVAIRDRPALGAARGDLARPGLAGRPICARSSRRAAACASRANSAPSPIAPPRSGASASAASRSPATPTR